MHPLVRQALPFVGHFVTRNRGTVGGSIAHADGAAELPLCLAVLDGEVVESQRGRREIAAPDFFVTHFLTTLAPGELVVETVWPLATDGETSAFEELAPAPATSRSRWPPVLRRDDVVVEARVGVGAVTDRPTRLPEVEALLVGLSGDDAAADAGARRAARRPAVHDARVVRLSPVHRHARPTGDRAGAMIEIELTVNGRVVRRRSSRGCC